MAWIFKAFLILLLITSLAHSDEELDNWLKMVNPSPNAVTSIEHINNVYILKIVDGNVTYLKSFKTPPPLPQAPPPKPKAKVKIFKAGGKTYKMKSWKSK